ncbi:MAG: VOC family protein [Promethearchaeota archaeon]|jgi:methylmalonyl-CoA/ethylmalonyl-CoA epimerase
MFGEIQIFGYVYRDVDAAIIKFKNLYGIEEFYQQNYPTGKSASAMVGQQQVNLIEPQDKDSIFYKFLENGNIGFHHIGFRVEDIDAKIK